MPPETRFVPIPARILLRSWVRAESPRIDRWLAPARVVHATNYLAPPTRLAEIVSVYDCSFIRFPELCTPEVRAFDPVIRRAVARGATLHTGSEFVADEIEEIYGTGLRAAGRLVVIPLGIPALGDASEMPESVVATVGDAPFVVAIGTLEPRKNFAHLVGRVRRARGPPRRPAPRHRGSRRPRPPRDRGRDRPAPRPARERVVLPGTVSDAGRRALLERATLLAYPSIYEGFGFPLLEAMSVGVPVVAARAGSIPEVAGDAALLVEPTNEQALADEMDRVITDDTTRAELVARGRDRVHGFSWNHTARALASCYRRLAEPGTA